MLLHTPTHAPDKTLLTKLLVECQFHVQVEGNQ